MRSWKFILPLLASSLCFAAQPDRISGNIDTSSMVAVAKSHHPKAQAQYDQGVVEPSLKLSYMTLLMAPSPSQQAALDQLLVQQQDRKSPNYHKWLTPQEFADRFGLSQNDLNKVTAWLKSEGFQILSTGGGRNSVIFSGTAAQAQVAFGTEIHRYNVNGEQHIANSTPLMIPAALSGIVRTVTGIHDFRPQPAYHAQGTSAGRIGRPNYYDGHFLFPNFLAPGDIATIYDIDPLYTASTPIDGTGQKLAIAGQTDIFLADINDFRSGFGLSTIPTTGAGACTTNSSGIIISPCNTTNFQYVLLGTDTGSVSANDIGEADLDIEWSGAVARNAQIIFINGETSNGVFDALIAAINPPAGPPLASVVSASYGEGCEFQSTLDLETTLQQGNAEGVTILNSSDDVGSAGCDFNPPNANVPFSPAVGGLGVSYPASSVYVTAVGGSGISLADDSNPPNPALWSTTIGANGGTALTYIPELAWNDDEELAQFCQGNAGSSFCAQGGSPAVLHWVPLTSSATAQQVQEDIWISMGGGGASNCWYETSGGICQGPGPGPTTGGGFPQPTWQQGLVVPSAPAGVRYVPDVSLFGSPDFPGYVFCTPQNPPTTNTSTCVSGIFTAVDTFQSIVGGTSVSSPAFAGIVTLLNQALGGTGLGNINSTLYTLAATPSNGVFHPITTGDNNVYCQPTQPVGEPSNIVCPSAGVFGFSAANADPTTGYNLVTGLGSVDVNKLVSALATPDFQLTAGSLSSSPVPAGQTTTATLTISAIAGSTAAVVNFAPSNCVGLPAGATCTFNPISVNFDGIDPVTTVVTISTQANMTVPSGAQTITITPTNSSQTPTTVSLTVAATNQSFSLSTGSTSTFSVAAGAAASVPISVTGLGSPLAFSPATLPLTYSCTQSSLPSEATCSFSPSGGNSVSATSLTLSIKTTAPISQLHPPLGRGSRIFYAMLLPGLFGIVCVAGSRKRGARLLGLIVVLGFSTLWLGSCGGGSNSSQSNPGTPAGSYMVTVNATTAGPTALTSTITVNLTVTQ